MSYQPVGIVFGIQPFNFPTYQVIRFSIPQLAAGNAVLLKHAHSVWGSALFLEQLHHDAGVPADLFRALKISSEQSDGVIANPLVRGVTLTGSATAGSAVASRAGKHLKKTVMELGSNDAYLILGDADIATAVEVCATARMYDNGETCVAAKRFVVVDSVFGPVASIIRVADDAEAMKVANDSRFGLGGGIISNDADKAIGMAIDDFETGMVNINGYNLANPHLPFGGTKDSGYGREHGGFGLKEFVNVKSIQVTES